MLQGRRAALPVVFDFLVSFQGLLRHVSSENAVNESGSFASLFEVLQGCRRSNQEAVGRSPAHWLLACPPVMAGSLLLMGGNLVANRGSQNLQDSRHSP